MDTPSNVRIIVRIRAPDVPEKSSNQEDKENQQKSQKPVNSSKSKSPVNKPRQLTKSPTNSTKPKKKVTPEKVVAVQTNTLRENVKYSIFTSLEPSNTIVISNSPISGKLINNTFHNSNDLYEYSYSLIKDASIMEFDRVYNEIHKIDMIYNDQIKDSISNLFIGRNSCILLFGPSESGKSYTLKEANSEEGGLLGKSINDILNLVEISRQAGTGKRNIVFSLKISIYQIFNDYCNDLLSNSFSKNLRIEKVNNENGISSKIFDLTEKEIKTKNDYENCLKEVNTYRKVLAQFLKVNEIKRKSHLVTSLIIERKERVLDGLNKINERILDRYSQIDFVELAASELGLPNELPKDKDDDIIYNNISRTFNSLCNNLVCSSLNQFPKYDCKLTLALKSTISPNSQLIFINCVNPVEETSINSYKSLKFSNWLRNQILNSQSNSDYKLKSAESGSEDERFISNLEDSYRGPKYQKEYEEDYKVNNKKEDIKNDRIRNKMQEFNNKKNQFNDEIEIKNYRNSRESLSSRKREEEDEIREMREKIKKKYPYMSSENESEGNTRPENLNLQSSENMNNMYFEDLQKPKNFKSFDRSYDKFSPGYIKSSFDKSYDKSDNDQIKQVERSLKDLEAKSQEMSRYIESLKNERSRIEDPRYGDYELEKMKQEYASLKSDNIIFREDINRLSEINRHLEDELSRQRNRNLELANDNERYAQERIQLKSDFDKLNDQVSKTKIQEMSLMEQFNNRLMMENKLRDYELENKTLRDEKQRLEVDYRVLLERQSEVKKQSENYELELNYLKNRQSEEVSQIELRLDKMSKEMDILQKDNNSLRINEARLRQEIINLEKTRDSYQEKYQEYKTKNNLLNAKLTEIEDDFRKLMYEKQSDQMEKKKNEDIKKMKVDSKQKIIEDMQSRISMYKTELLKQRNKKE